MVNGHDDDVTFQAAEHHRSLTTIKLYCLMTHAGCEQLAQSYYVTVKWPRVESAYFSESLSVTSHNHYFITP